MRDCVLAFIHVYACVCVRLCVRMCATVSNIFEKTYIQVSEPTSLSVHAFVRPCVCVYSCGYMSSRVSICMGVYVCVCLCRCECLRARASVCVCLSCVFVRVFVCVELCMGGCGDFEHAQKHFQLSDLHLSQNTV